MWTILSKYIVVGVINTLFTLSIIYILMILDINMFYANAIGYVAGILLSFILNSLFTFTTHLHFYKFVKFLFTCLGCYLINLMTIKLFLNYFPDMKYFSQLMGMGFYTITGFMLNKLWAMK